ncbi:MAG: hypothetical protein H7145_08805 [Akkermansiaceae bacterium]|nr:hypothetical protein [Armatimonadota bacterium]
MSYSIFNDPSAPLSVSRVPTTDEAGQDYKHRIEPELAFANIPRLAGLMPSTLIARRCLWNAALVAVLVVIYFGQRDIRTWDRMIESGVTVEAVVFDDAEHSKNNAASFRFQADGETMGAERPVSDTESLRFRVGHTFPVTYLPGTQGEIWREGRPDGGQRNDRLRFWILGGLGTLGLFAVTIFAFEERWKRQLYFLRGGVAVHGLVRSGAVIDSVRPSQFRIRYTYWVGTGQMSAGANVSEQQFRELTRGNPYFTVLYDATDPSVSKPYFQCSAAYLVAK